MDLRVIGVLLLVPLLDVMLLVVLATRLGPAVTVALVVLTAFIGLLLVRAEGRHTLGRLQAKVAEGTPPTDELLDGALLLIAGALMLTPGLVTDLVGLLFVLPPTRYPIRLAVKKYVVTPYVDAKTGGFATGNVYMGGFPNEGAEGDPRSEEFFKQGGSGPVDMDDDEYEFTDPDDQDAGSDDGFTDVRFDDESDDESDDDDPRER
ncbi:FxsA family protein [Natronomonas sp.]|uniref:FxsA family protein n=1 Tax=Natronomonas sp. TaxID=2184060 RepID=UPI002FC38209